MASEEANELASLAGFTVAFFNSNSELKKYFNQALAEDWTADRLLAAAKNTKWFKTTNEPGREAVALRTSDPAEANRRVREMRIKVGRMAVELGVPLGGKNGDALAQLAFNGGWGDDQIRSYMARYNSVYANVAKGKILGGTIGQAQARIRQAARDYGVAVSNKWLGTQLQKVGAGQLTEQHVLASMQNMAISAFPGLADEIRAGKTVRDVAEPYFQTMAQILEINTEAVDLTDPTIRKALSAKDAKGVYSPQSIADFEVSLRKDKRWQKTDNARDSMMKEARGVFQAFGVAT